MEVGAAFIRQEAYAQVRARFVLKSPPHTARIRLLLEIFPNARFLHIRHDPHTVFRSTVHMLASISPYWSLYSCWQMGTEEALVERVLTTYRVMYDAFFEQRELVPSGRFYEFELRANSSSIQSEASVWLTRRSSFPGSTSR